MVRINSAFLEEASLILNMPALVEAAEQFRSSAQAWQALGCALLPDDISGFGQIRVLMRHRRDQSADQRLKNGE